MVIANINFSGFYSFEKLIMNRKSLKKPSTKEKNFDVNNNNNEAEDDGDINQKDLASTWSSNCCSLTE
jgi:hypothetical protein